MGNRHNLLGSLNTITPCAACKLLRRRCAEECPFSPYFSPHEPHKFAAVHKVFGASNVSKLLMVIINSLLLFRMKFPIDLKLIRLIINLQEVGESQRADAANSLVYEANLRLRDPVYGCMGAIVTLQQQMQSLQAELNAVRAEILKYKFRENTTATATATATSTISNIIPSTIASPSSPLPPPSPPSVVVSSSSSSSTSSLYTPAPTSAAVAYTSISADNVPYFDQFDKP